MYLCYFSADRNIRNLVHYIFVILEGLRKEKLNLIISNNVAVFVSFF